MTAIPRVSGVLETSLYVEDLDRSRTCYQRLFGFEQFMRDSRDVRAGGTGRASAAAAVPAWGNGPAGTRTAAYALRMRSTSWGRGIGATAP